MNLADAARRALVMPDRIPATARSVEVEIVHARELPDETREHVWQSLKDATSALNTLLLAGFGQAGHSDGVARIVVDYEAGLRLHIIGSALEPLLIACAVRLAIGAHHAPGNPAIAAIMAEEGFDPPTPILFADTVDSVVVRIGSATTEEGPLPNHVSGLSPVASPTRHLTPDIIAQADRGALDVEMIVLPRRRMPDAAMEDAILQMHGSGAFVQPGATDNIEPEFWTGTDGALRVGSVTMDLSMLDALVGMLSD